MKEGLHIILVEDNKVDAELLEIELSEKFLDTEFRRVDNEVDLVNCLTDFNPDLVISDYSMPGFSGNEALSICQSLKPDVPFIFVSGTIGEERAVEALKNGASDYVLKSSLARLPHAAQVALHVAREKIEKEQQQKEIRQLSVVASQIDNGVWIGNTELRTQWVNSALIVQTGFSYDEFSSMSIIELLAEVESNENIDKIILHDLKEGNYVYQEVQLKRKNNTVYWASIDITPISNEIGEIEKIVAIVNDISKRKRAELERDELLKTLEIKVNERTAALQLANSELNLKNKDILDSIYYARHIQEAFIPELSPRELKVQNAFVINLPKDVLSGDFHWQRYIPDINKTYFALGDCTGHGVPGSLMTMLAIQFLEQQISEKTKPKRPNVILHKIDESIIKFLGQKLAGSLVNDGLEIMLVCIDHNSNEIRFSGAGRSLFYYTDGKITRYDSPHYSVGGDLHLFSKEFHTREIQAKSGDRFYAFSDGFSDQFGGPNKKKYSRKRKREFLFSIQQNDFNDHESLLRNEFDNWKGDLDQIDDVIVLGVEF